MAATMAFAAFQPFPSLFSNYNLRRVPILRLVSSASGFSSDTTEFNISSGAAPSVDVEKAAPGTLIPDTSPAGTSAALPWIVRREDGQLTIQSALSTRFLHQMAEAKMAEKELEKKKKKNDKRKPPGATVSSSPSLASSTSAPKYSKAARRFYNQNIREKSQLRLSKALAAAGVASRRSCEELIFEGKVTVNGSVCTSPQTRVDLVKDSIYVNGARLSKKLPPKLYFAVNKPKGYICSNADDSKSVFSLFGGFLNSWSKSNPGRPKPRLFTAGRLDVATTGLIIVTNDGDFAQRISHPSSGLTKEYIATVEGKVQRRHLIALSEGTQVEGVHCTPEYVEVLSDPTSRPRLRIVVHEGKNHEVRELVKNAGLELYSLKRVRIGGFRLPPDLGLGKYVELKQRDFELFEGSTRKNT